MRVEPMSEDSVAAEVFGPDMPDSAAMDGAAEDAALSTVDYTIELYLDEISERTQRAWDNALAAMRAQNWAQAELEFETVIAEEPGLPGPYVNLALIYKQDGRTNEMRAALEQAIAIAPEFAPANNELGLLLRERGEFDAAEAAYRNALAGDPGNALAHLNLGILLDLYLKRSGEALEHYTAYQTSRVEPDEVVARWIVDLERRVRAAERVAAD